jgi:hypothetical protein
MVKEGLVQQSTDGGTSATIPLGDCFGQACLTSDEKTTASSKLPTWPGKIVAVGSVTLLRLKREHVIETLGDLWSLMRENFQQVGLRSRGCACVRLHPCAALGGGGLRAEICAERRVAPCVLFTARAELDLHVQRALSVGSLGARRRDV